jgi:xylulokinase
LPWFWLAYKCLGRITKIVLKTHNTEAAPDGWLLALDIGTSSSRAALVGLDGGMVGPVHRYYTPAYPRTGWVVFDPEEWWMAVADAIRTLLQDSLIAPDSIRAVAACAQMHGAVPVDGLGEALCRAVPLWNDKRAASLVADWPDDPNDTNPPTTAWPGFKIAWIRQNWPELYERTHCFLSPKDFINLRLTGVQATDVTEASCSFLVDAQHPTRYWPERCAALGVDRAKLPTILPSSEVVGVVTARAAHATGLPEGLPVVAGAGDFPASVLSAGHVPAGSVLDVTGTSALLVLPAAGPRRGPRVMNIRDVAAGWMQYCVVEAAGDCLSWARRLFGSALSYAAMAAEAMTAPPGADGLLFLPFLGGERMVEGTQAGGQFVGLSHRHGRAHMLRAIIEGVTQAQRRELATLRQLDPSICQVLSLGGAAVSDEWPTLKAQILGLPVLVQEPAEGGLLGTAALAAAGLGLVAQARDFAASFVQTRAIFTPDPALVSLYDEQALAFGALHSATSAAQPAAALQRWRQWYE